jgi:hypothetical protein
MLRFSKAKKETLKPRLSISCFSSVTQTGCARRGYAWRLYNKRTKLQGRVQRANRAIMVRYLVDALAVA